MKSRVEAMEEISQAQASLDAKRVEYNAKFYGKPEVFADAAAVQLRKDVKAGIEAIARMNAELETLPKGEEQKKAEKDKVESSAFTRFLLGGWDRVGADERKDASVHSDGMPGNGFRVGALSRPAFDDRPEGIFDTETMAKIFETRKWFGGPRKGAQRQVVSNMRDIIAPNLNDTGEEGNRGSEGAQVPTEAHPTFGDTRIQVARYDSGVESLTFEAMASSVIDLESRVMKTLTRKVGRKQARDFTITDATGTAPRPEGMLTGITRSVSTLLNSGIGYADLQRTKNNIDHAYLEGREGDLPNLELAGQPEGRVAWMMHQDQLSRIEQLTANGRPLLQRNEDASAATMVLPTILGFPVIVNNFMPNAFAAENDVVALFGLFENYLITDVGEMMDVYRFDDSAYTTRGRVGFMAMCWADGRYVGPKDSITRLVRRA